MNPSFLIVASFILATTFVISSISGGWLFNTAAAKTTHEYCYATRAGGIVENNSCVDTLKGCQQELATFIEANPSYQIFKSCFKVTNSDKSTTNYCFDIEGGPSCFGSKQACQSNREAVLAGFNGFRVSSECYKT